MPAKPGVKLVAGSIGKLVDYEGTQVVDICDGYNAFGIIGTKRSLKELSFDREDMVAIWPQRMVFRTDVFDDRSSLEYNGGQSMYVNSNGLLSPECPWENSLYVAKLISRITKEDKIYIECLWL